MAPHPVHQDWQRLGKLLKQRRPQLDPRYRTRRTFADETHLNDKTVQEIENAYRQTFTDEMLSAIEVAYRLPGGTIARVLTDPDINELPPPTDRRTPEPPPPLMIPDHVSLTDLEPWEQDIWNLARLTVEERATAILFVRLQRGDLDDDTEALLRLHRAIGAVVDRHLERNGPPRAV